MKKIFLFLISFLIITSCSTSPKNQSIQDLIRQGKIEEAKSYFSTKADINEQDAEGNTVLHIASIKNDEDLLTFLLIKGANPEIKNYESKTPLMLAIENDCYDSVRVLTNAGANIFAKNIDEKTTLELAIEKDEIFYDLIINEKTSKQKDDNGKTIIHYFVTSENYKALSFAIKKNLPIDEPDNNSVTPLKIALSNPQNYTYAKIANELLLAGAQEIKNETDYFQNSVIARNYSLTLEDGQTPLHYAAIKNHSGIAKFLLENKAKTSAQDINGSTPLHEACRYGNIEIAKELLKAKANVNAQDSLGKTPLLLIIPEENRFDIYKLLIEHNADINHKDSFGDTILHTAAMTKINNDTLELLLNSGADVNIRNKSGNTALSTAVEHKLINQIRLLVNHNADIHAENSLNKTPYINSLSESLELFKEIITTNNISSIDSNGNTPLLIAIQNDAPIDKIEYLISLDKNINARNKEGNSALYYAVKNNKKEIGTMLLEKNANIFSANTQDISPLKLFLTESKNDWLLNSKTITEKDSSGNTVLHYSTDWKLYEGTKFLIQKGAIVDAKNVNGQTPLFNAVKNDDIEIIDLLISNAANINERDNFGSTILHSAVRWNALQSIEKLISLNMNPNVQNIHGKTPLAEAAIEGNIATTTLLLSKGADPNIYDSFGRTSLVDAIKAKQVKIVSLLLKHKANPQIQDMNGRTPYHEAALSENIQIIKLIYNAKGNPLSRDKDGNTPLSIAFNKDLKVLETVLGENKNITDSEGNTPIHICIQKKAKNSTLKFLIENDYPYDTRNSYGYTPLALSVINNEKDSAIVLLEKGANPFAEINNKGDTVLSLAFKNDNNEILSSIVKYAANKTDIKGNSILHYAAKFGNATTVKRLLAFGLDKNVKNFANETPYEIAINWKHKEIAELLK